jgi:hypothetical protein
MADALRSRISSIAAAPFEVLGELVGREAVSLASVAFEPGAATPAAPDLDSLGALAAALLERPALGVTVTRGFAAHVDRDALAAQQIQLHVTLATAGPSLRALPIDFASPRAQDVLDEFGGERLGAARLAAIAARFPFDPSDEPAAPRRVAYYQALFDALAANEPIDEAALLRLGRYRAQSVANRLAELGVAPSRVSTVGGSLATSADLEVVRVPLEIHLLVAPSQ